MIRLVRTMTVLLVAVASFGAHAADGQDANGPSAWEKVTTFAHKQKDDAVTHGGKLMAEIDRKITVLQADAKKAAGETKAAYNASIADLKIKRRQAAAQLAKMQKSSSAAWGETKRGFADAYKSLHGAYERASAAYK